MKTQLSKPARSKASYTAEYKQEALHSDSKGFIDASALYSDRFRRTCEAQLAGAAQ
jgi:hypothetical protein